MISGGNNKLFGIIVAILVSLLSIFLFAKNARAAEEHILLNEIYPNPNTGEIEWIELYNPTDSPIDLGSWTAEDGTHKPKLLSGKTIDTKSYLVLSSGSDFSFGLNNDGEIIQLKNSTSVIDQVAYGNWSADEVVKDNNAKAPPKGKSITRIVDMPDTDIDKNDFVVADKTPGAPYIPQVYTNDIKINEIYSHPTSGEEEFVELFNSGGQEVDLSGWYLDDIDGGSSPFLVPAGTIINVGQYMVFNHLQTGIYFNDDGDSARLLSPDLAVKDEIVYSDPTIGQSYAKFSDGWRWTATVTPAAANIYTQVPEQPPAALAVINIADARAKSLGTKLKIRGIVSVAPGILSNSYFYIQDGTGGMQIYSYDKDFPALSAGDEIEVSGELSSIADEERIKIDGISSIILLRHASLPDPKPVVIDQIGEDDEGQLIITTGEVLDPSGDSFKIEGSGQIAVIVRENSGVNKPRLKSGMKVQIRGIVSQYKNSYRILPFGLDGVTILSSGVLPVTGADYSSNSRWNIFQRICKIQKELLPLWQTVLLAVMLLPCMGIWAAVKPRRLNLSASILV